MSGSARLADLCATRPPVVHPGLSHCLSRICLVTSKGLFDSDIFRSRPTRAPQYSGCITTSGRVTSLLQVSVHIRLPIFLYNAFYNEVVGYARVVAERDRQAS